MLQTTPAPFRFLVAAVIVTGLLASGIPTSPAVADRHGQTNDPGMYVVLEDDGSATVELRLAYDLSDESERKAFEQLESDSETKQNLTDNYHQRMQSIADTAAAETGREMTVTNPSSEIYTTDDGDTGVVELSVDWSGFATVRDDGTVVVTEPFASGFVATERVVILPPEGYSAAEASPTPDKDGDRLVWEAGTDMNGFEAQFEPADSGGLNLGLVAVAGGAVVVGVGGLAARRML